jgi:hypothetical protein
MCHRDRTEDTGCSDARMTARRLAAMLAVDGVGYSCLSADDGGALPRQGSALLCRATRLQDYRIGLRQSRRPDILIRERRIRSTVWPKHAAVTGLSGEQRRIGVSSELN